MRYLFKFSVSCKIRLGKDFRIDVCYKKDWYLRCNTCKREHWLVSDRNMIFAQVGKYYQGKILISVTMALHNSLGTRARTNALRGLHLDGIFLWCHLNHGVNSSLYKVRLYSSDPIISYGFSKWMGRSISLEEWTTIQTFVQKKKKNYNTNPFNHINMNVSREDEISKGTICVHYNHVVDEAALFYVRRTHFWTV